MRAVLDRQDGVDRHEVARLEAVGQLHHLALLVAQGDARPQVGAARLLLPVDHHAVGDARGLVDHLAHRHAFDQVDVVGDALLLGDDRQRVGVPLGQALALLDLVALVDQQLGAVGHPVDRPLAIAIVLEDDLQVAPHDHRDALRIRHHVAIADLHRGVARRLDARLLGAALGGPADVEGAHGQLRTRLADRLRGDHADRLADVDRRAAGQIAAVALGADAAA